MANLPWLLALRTWWQADDWLTTFERILLFFILAWLVHRLAPYLARRLVQLRRFAPRGGADRPERRATLQSVLASLISYAALALALVLTLKQFVSATTLVWVIGLFSAAFGLGARAIVSDVVSGISILFDDIFAVGEKVAIVDVEGVVEAVDLRTTRMRAITGELYIVPNGDIRLVRNFSRGRFSAANVTILLASADLPQALPVLEALGQDAVALLPDLIEPWRVISESGVIGQQTGLTLLAKARFGRAAELRPHLLALVHDRLLEVGIALAS
jgi:small-conductance mechanosensitive channel